jgi:hypothetical protein
VHRPSGRAVVTLSGGNYRSRGRRVVRPAAAARAAYAATLYNSHGGSGRALADVAGPLAQIDTPRREDWAVYLVRK